MGKNIVPNFTSRCGMAGSAIRTGWSILAVSIIFLDSTGPFRAKTQEAWSPPFGRMPSAPISSTGLPWIMKVDMTR